ncbi:MAG: hypothetical protein ACI9KD_003054, partial [Congregibacter sp.]
GGRGENPLHEIHCGGRSHATHNADRFTVGHSATVAVVQNSRWIVIKGIAIGEERLTAAGVNEYDVLVFCEMPLTNQID